MKSTDPKLVSLEPEIMSAHVGGAHPVSILKHYGERIQAGASDECLF
jgi:hypothetical protein